MRFFIVLRGLSSLDCIPIHCSIHCNEIEEALYNGPLTQICLV